MDCDTIIEFFKRFVLEPICSKIGTKFNRDKKGIYLMDEYNGNGEIVNSTSLKAEYWELGYYDETAECSFGDRSITSEEYEKLKQEIFG